jgi:hypothetical protein
MRTLERILIAFVVALVAWLPFEFRHFPFMSNLQWLFAAVAVTAVPIVFRERSWLWRDRLILAALVFVGTQWLTAFTAEEFTLNSIKGAVRVTSGFTLLCVILCLRDRKVIVTAWSITAIIAALYGILDYNGFGLTRLFREEEFYVGSAVRLAGSFEYPNTAAAFLALSLPLVWSMPKSRWLWVAGSLSIWLALLLTYSRGAVIAVLSMLLTWTIAGRSRSRLIIVALCVATFAAVFAFSPRLDRLQRQVPENVLAAEYQPEFNVLRHRPADTGNMTIVVKNIGSATWSPGETQPVSISYRWYDRERRERVRVNQIHVQVPHPVLPNQSVILPVSFYTPNEPGHYLLVWEMARRGDGWFKTRGLIPGVVMADIQTTNEPWYGQGDVSQWHRPENATLFLEYDAIERTDLWKAALSVALENPLLGVGPDNFRLLYGEQLGLAVWDTKIRSNNMYLELITGSGLVGLIAFVLMMASVRWSLSAFSIALGIFLVHGLVDVFLMTTPIYFAFWTLLGLAHSRSPENQTI